MRLSVRCSSRSVWTTHHWVSQKHELFLCHSVVGFKTHENSGWEIIEMLWCVCIWNIFRLGQSFCSASSYLRPGFWWCPQVRAVSPSEPWRWAEVEATRCGPARIAPAMLMGAVLPGVLVIAGSPFQTCSFSATNLSRQTWWLSLWKHAQIKYYGRLLWIKCEVSYRFLSSIKFLLCFPLKTYNVNGTYLAKGNRKKMDGETPLLSQSEKMWIRI